MLNFGSTGDTMSAALPLKIEKSANVLLTDISMGTKVSPDG